MVYHYRFSWPVADGIESVYVTGNFDQWSKSLALEKGGPFFVGWVLVANKEDLVFKFVVNGEWLVSKDYSIETDEHGNENNTVAAEDLLISKDEKRKLTVATTKSTDIDKHDGHKIEKSASAITITAPTVAAVTPEPISGSSDPISSVNSVPSGPSETPAPSEHSEIQVTPETEPISLPLTHVNTTSSSFAGMSISADSAFENVHKEEVKPISLAVEKELDDDDDAHEFDTPTNSIVNTPSTPKKGEIHIPGAFPSSSTTSSNVQLDRKDGGLIAKFKSLFR